MSNDTTLPQEQVEKVFRSMKAGIMRQGMQEVFPQYLPQMETIRLALQAVWAGSNPYLVSGEAAHKLEQDAYFIRHEVQEPSMEATLEEWEAWGETGDTYTLTEKGRVALDVFNHWH